MMRMCMMMTSKDSVYIFHICLLQVDIIQSPTAQPVQQMSPSVSCDSACTSFPDTQQPRVGKAVSEVDTVPSVEQLQCRLRQLLHAMINSTYNLRDADYLESSLKAAQEQLASYKAHSAPSARVAAFRRNRRIARSSHAALGLRRRLAVIKARRRNRNMLQKIAASGTKYTSMTVFETPLGCASTACCV